MSGYTRNPIAGHYSVTAVEPVADPPGRAPNPSWWAVRRPDWITGPGWRLITGRHQGTAYREQFLTGVITADAALAWLTDHRRRNPR